MQFEITCEEADMCHGMFGKKEPSTTMQQRVEINNFLTLSGVTFQRTCLLCHRSKVLKVCCVVNVRRVVRLKLNKMQSELAVFTQALANGVKFFGE